MGEVKNGGVFKPALRLALPADVAEILILYEVLNWIKTFFSHKFHIRS